MKTVKQKAKEWHCTEREVREYCLIIPNAYKSNRFPFSWQIPDVDIPPCKPQLAKKYLDIILLIKEGSHINFETLGNSLNKTEEIYTYLSDCGFMTPMGNKGDLNKRLKKVQITNLGKELCTLLKGKKEKSQKTTKKEAHVDLHTGVIDAGASIESFTDNKRLV